VLLLDGQQTNIDGLRVLNFRKELLRPHPAEVTELYGTNIVDSNCDVNNLICCKSSQQSLEQDSNMVCEYQSASDIIATSECMPLECEVEDDIIFESDSVVESDDMIITDEELCHIMDDLDETLPYEIDEESNNPANEQDAIKVVHDMDIRELLLQLMFSYPVTTEQHICNEIILTLSDESVKTFLIGIYLHMHNSFKSKITPEKPEVKSIRSFYAELHSSYISEEYRIFIRKLFDTNDNDISSNHYNVGLKLVTKLRQHNFVCKFKRCYFAIRHNSTIKEFRRR
jgi:hypothetical protein